MKNLSLLLLLLAAFSGALAQTMETPVSFDSGGKIFEWDKKLESSVPLFPGIKDFQKAHLWQSDSLYWLEVFVPQKRLRTLLSRIDLDSIRAKADFFLTGNGYSLALNQEGRGAYLLWQIPLSLGWYGPAVLGIVQPEEGTTGAGLYLASASASYFIPFMITNNRQVTSGQEHLSIACGFRGITAGVAISNLLDMEDSKGYFATMLATSISGQIAGYHYGKLFTKPQARMISNYATFGMVQLPLASLLFNIDYGSEKAALNAHSTYLLAGMTGGACLGYKLLNKRYYSDGHPTIIATAGWTGLLAGTGTYFFLRGPYDGSSFSLSRTDVRTATFMALATSSAGLYLAHKYTKGYTFSRGDGFIVMGSTAAGGLLGCGLGFLIHPSGESESNDVFQSISGLSSLGMVAGYGLGLHSVRNQNHKSLGGLRINSDGLPLAAMLAINRRQHSNLPWITVNF